MLEGSDIYTSSGNLNGSLGKYHELLRLYEMCSCMNETLKLNLKNHPSRIEVEHRDEPSKV